jgi:hypothetical protein
MSRVLALALSAALAVAAALPARADDLMTRFSGEWVGTGKLLFGPQYGTEFNCELKGNPSESLLNFNLTGRCWLGALSAPVYARLRYNTDTRQYYGEFMDGADGQGVDIVGARAGEAISLRLMRGRLQGRLTAETVNSDQMKVMMFYRDIENNRELPVVAMGFARKGTGRLPDYLPGFVTGSITPQN